MSVFVRGGVEGVNGKVRTGSGERSRSKEAKLRVGIQGFWVNGIEVNSAAVLSAYLRL